jgi:hypothetical protein
MLNTTLTGIGIPHNNFGTTTPQSYKRQLSYTSTFYNIQAIWKCFIHHATLTILTQEISSCMFEGSKDNNNYNQRWTLDASFMTSSSYKDCIESHV